MRLRTALGQTASAPLPKDFRRFRDRIDLEWIEQALESTGTATVRRRRLPAEQVVWLVIGIALLRDRSIVEVVDSLDLALPGKGPEIIAASSVAQARDRLGAEPMRAVFDTCAERWAYASAQRHLWRGLSLYGADGTSLRVPDTPENRAHFDSQHYGGGGEGSYPQVRVVALMALRSHLLVAASFGPYSIGEATYARDLWSKLPAHSLCIVDRNFLSAQALVPLARDGEERHWLIRAKKNTSWRVVRRLGRNDLIVEMNVSSSARKFDPSLPAVWTVRAIQYRRKGYQPQWLLTSMLDADRYPATEIATLYHERWELELAYDEIKTEILDREETLRSKSPERIGQEIWGILIAYNLVRLEMERVAEEARVEPTRISFVVALQLICDEWILDANTAPGAIPRHLKRLRSRLRRLVLPPRRPKRSCPRAVKVPMSSYPSLRRLRSTSRAK